MMDNAIENIANLIVEEARSTDSHNNLISSIHRVQYLLGREMTKKKNEIRRKEIAWRLFQSCPKGGNHVWGTDGAHSNQFCKNCFVSRGD